MHENALVESLRHRFATADPSVLAGCGPDDCAHLVAASPSLAVSVDAFAEGSHFLPDTPPAAVARKALGAAASDLAASACRPRWALVSLCLRRGAGDGWATAFADGLAAAAREFGVLVVGGDTVAAATTVISVTVIGEPMPGGPVLRAGGNSGDVLVVTGTLGGSLLGRHLRPVPRVREVERLMEFCRSLPDMPRPSAMMDLSDGLALDLARLCRESGVGALVDAAAVPIDPAAREASAASGRTALAHALTDGEDFEVLVTLAPAVWTAFTGFLTTPAGQAAFRDLAPFRRIGELTAEAGIRLRHEGGEQPLAAEGYEHTW